MIGLAIWWRFGPAPDPQQQAEPSYATADQPCGTRSNPCKVEQRTYAAAIPRGDGPFPVVLYFHGSGQSGAGALANGFLSDPILKRGYAIVAPDALDITYRGDRRMSGWIWEGRRDMRDDYRFVQSVLADAARTFPLDTDRVLVAGASNGATFAWYLACANRFPGLKFFAPVGGTPVRGRPLKCKTVRPRFHLIHTHGTQDNVVPAEGSYRADGWSGWLGAEEAVADLAGKASCLKTATEQDGPAKITSWTRCRAGNSFRVVLTPDGHYLPVDWADRTLDWFEDVSGAKGSG